MRPCDPLFLVQNLYQLEDPDGTLMSNDITSNFALEQLGLC